MINRTLSMTLLAALGIHIIGMSVVSIIPPEDEGRIRPYTRVDFLGAILRKTAFDIMLEKAISFSADTYNHIDQEIEDKYLKATISRTEPEVEDFSEQIEADMDTRIKDFLSGDKVLPDVESGSIQVSVSGVTETAERGIDRKVIYRPEPPYIMRGLYGDKNSFKITIEIVVSADGKIEMAEPVYTTGFPDIDIIAIKYVKSWIFESRKDITDADDRKRIEFILTCRD